MGEYRLIHGDCLVELCNLPANSVDAIVTDPPYELGFMGKSWDSTGIAFSPDTWRACLRVLKPGGHMLCFGGSRTFHRIAVAIEDAGFELRDTVMWVYGSGFPKSHDVSKAIDKEAGATRTEGYTRPEYVARSNKLPQRESQVICGDKGVYTLPATDAAKQWQGWGTALKPAFEPIILARKPVEGAVAANVLKWGTGAINVDGCRVEGAKGVPASLSDAGNLGWRTGGDMERKSQQNGRWPANFIHDGSEEVLELMPDVKTGSMNGVYNNTIMAQSNGNRNGKPIHLQHEASSGSAARFFYCAKASKRDRDEGCEGVITWENVDLSQEMLELRELLKDISADMMQELANVEWSTIWSGKKLPYATSLKDMLFITSTGLKMTTDLKTLSACPSLSTNDFTRAVLEMSRVNGLSLATTADSIDLLKQATTSDQMALALDAVVAVLMLLWRIKEKGRQGNGHATVKPTSLMRYLCRLITPPNGTILDPFMGSGSTGKAAMLEGFNFIGIEREQEYVEIAEARIGATTGASVAVIEEQSQIPGQLTLF